MEMKEIFGSEKAADIFKFIDKNFDLGQERIIELWIEKEYKDNLPK